MGAVTQIERGEERYSPLAPPTEARFDSVSPLQDEDRESRTIEVSRPKNKREFRLWNKAIEYDKLDAKATRSEYDRLHRELSKNGKAAVLTVKASIPNLSNMQCLLSQRGKCRLPVLAAAKLPSWSDYLKKHAEKYGISERQLRRKITQYRGKAPKVPKAGADKPVKMNVSQSQIRRLVAGAEKLGAIVDAHKNHQDVDPLIEQAERVIMAPDEQLKVLEGFEPDPLEKVMVPVLAAGLRYIKTQEDVIYYHAKDINPERHERLEKYKAEWRSALPTAGYVYEKAKSPAPVTVSEIEVKQIDEKNEAIKVRPDGQLTIVPLHVTQANALVSRLHRHHKPIRVAKFSIGASRNGQVVGAAICMRPASRALDDGLTIEVCRMVTVDTEDNVEDNACSLLYATCAKIAKLMGFTRIQTYILETESGMSLRGAGWTLEATNCGGTPQGKRTNRPNGHEVTPVTFMKKQRWGRTL